MISGIAGLIFGWIIGFFTRIVQLNFSNDQDARQRMSELVDETVDLLHSKYTQAENVSSSTALDYRIKDLMSDTRLIDVIGRASYDDVYTSLISDLYVLTTPRYKELSDSERKETCERASDIGVKIKRTINSGNGSFRVFKRR